MTCSCRRCDCLRLKWRRTLLGDDYPVYGSVPETSFICDGLVDGGYYADPEAQCQVPVSFSFIHFFSTLLQICHPARFHCVGGRWDWTQDFCNSGFGSESACIRIILGSWIWIRICIWVKFWIRICIKVKIPELLAAPNWSLDSRGEPWTLSGVECRKWSPGGSVDQWAQIRIILMRRIRIQIRIQVKTWIRTMQGRSSVLAGPGSRILCWNGRYKY